MKNTKDEAVGWGAGGGGTRFAYVTPLYKNQTAHQPSTEPTALVMQRPVLRIYNVTFIPTKTHDTSVYIQPCTHHGNRCPRVHSELKVAEHDRVWSRRVAESDSPDAARRVTGSRRSGTAQHTPEHNTTGEGGGRGCHLLLASI